MTTRKYQQGGLLSNTQQQGLQYLAQMYAQLTGKDPQQDQEGFMLFVQQLAQQAGVQDIGQLLDMIYLQAAGLAQAAKRGAKLNYLKTLSNKCPEGLELAYLRIGGKVCSKCMAKKVKTEKCGSKMKKKKACGGFKMTTKKFQLGGGINNIPFNNIPKGQKGLRRGIKQLNPNKLNYDVKADYKSPHMNVNGILNGDTIPLNVNEGQLYGEDPILYNGKTYILNGDSTLTPIEEINNRNNQYILNLPYKFGPISKNPLIKGPTKLENPLPLNPLLLLKNK